MSTPTTILRVSDEDALVGVEWDNGRVLGLVLPEDGYAVINEVPASELKHGMVIRTPSYLRGQERDGDGFAYEQPVLADTLRVDLWDWEDGECLLTSVDGRERVEPCTVDLGGAIVVVYTPAASVPLNVVYDFYGEVHDSNETDDERFDQALEFVFGHDDRPLEEDEETDEAASREWAYQLMAARGTAYNQSQPHPGTVERLQEETVEVCLKFVVRKDTANQALEELVALVEARPDYVAFLRADAEDLEEADATTIAVDADNAERIANI